MNDVELVARLMESSQSTVLFTGAGTSTASGIPDFRSPGGIWEKYRPVMFQDFMRDRTARQEYWRQKSEAHLQFADARPNRGHQIIAKWERTGRIRGVITQNIDELHQMAGSKNVLELHGTARKVSCLDCGFKADADDYVLAFKKTGTLPTCPDCQGDRMKHATISFGQSLPSDVLYAAAEWSRHCDLFLAIGSSLVVTPAADLPRLAKEHGASLVIINRDPTPLDAVADALLRADISETLHAIDRKLSGSSDQ